MYRYGWKFNQCPVIAMQCPSSEEARTDLRRRIKKLRDTCLDAIQSECFDIALERFDKQTEPVKLTAGEYLFFLYKKSGRAQ
jgi:hypothetical protein